MISNRSARVYCSLAILAWNTRRHCASAFLVSATPAFISNPTIINGNVAFQSSNKKRGFASSAPLAMSDQTEVDVASNLEQVRERLVKACEDAGRDPAQVRLVAVSKTKRKAAKKKKGPRVLSSRPHLRLPCQHA